MRSQEGKTGQLDWQKVMVKMVMVVMMMQDSGFSIRTEQWGEQKSVTQLTAADVTLVTLYVRRETLWHSSPLRNFLDKLFDVRVHI